jgi:prephenate dehydrogenase
VATVTAGSPRVYRDIQRAFDGADDVAAAARRVAESDDESFVRLYREAGGDEP